METMKSAPSRETTILLTTVLLACIGTSVAALGADTPKPIPPGYSTSLSGSKEDFDYLVGAWTTQQKRLKAFGVSGSEWIEAPANRHCVLPYSGGRAIVEQSQLPNNEPVGLFLYTFSPTKQQWAIRWVDAKTGQPDPPYIGGFKGNRGEFYGEDEYKGRPIKVRIIWTNPDHDHARWEQSFSYDDRTWEINWISDFTRGDPTVICSKV
jgi:hypothetical protein